MDGDLSPGVQAGYVNQLAVFAVQLGAEASGRCDPAAIRLVRQRLTQWIEDLRSVGGNRDLARAVEELVERLSAALAAPATLAAEAQAISDELARLATDGPQPPAKRGADRRSGSEGSRGMTARSAPQRGGAGGPRPVTGLALAAVLACSPTARPPGDRVGRGEPVEAAAAAMHPAARVDAARPANAAGIADASVVAADAPAIVDAPMAWSAERERLTLAYRRQHSDPEAADLAIDPRAIILHYTDGGSAAATRRYFDGVRIEAARGQLAAAGAVNVSAHFIVDRDGTIYQLQPATRFARHCIGMNHIAIGIENAGDEGRFPLTEAQVAADAALVRYLAQRYRITHLLGHHEVMAFRDHPYYVERDRDYRNDKPDPGARFMALVRARVADLGLRGPR